jgi:hypothetical protein
MSLNETIEKLLKGTTALLVAGNIGFCTIFGVNLYKNNNVFEHKSKQQDRIVHAHKNPAKSNEDYHFISYYYYRVRVIDGIISYKEISLTDVPCCGPFRPSQYYLVFGNLLGERKEYYGFGDRELIRVLVFKDNRNYYYFAPECNGSNKIENYEEENEFFKEQIEKFEMLME